MESYRYVTLNSNHEEFRLIKLLPGHRTSEIQVDIFLSKYSSDIEYEALSYVWGSPKLARSIHVVPSSGWKQKAKRWSRTSTTKNIRSTTTLAITESLFIALLHLRDQYFPRILWIDAVCINQEDLIERSEEVGQMTTIYSRARQVLIWLGPEADNSSLAISTLKSIAQDAIYRSVYHTILVLDDSPTGLLERDAQALQEMSSSWVAIKHILRRKWFTRLWIVQEISLAKEAIILIGNHRLKWNEFVPGVLWIQNRIMETGPVRDVIKLTDTEPAHRLLYLIREFKSGACSLSYGIDGTKKSSCFDPRDRIYALLSLLSSDERKDIYPDYSRSTEDVYKNVMLQYFRNQTRLNMLEFCTLRNESTNLKLPSWVPDFSLPKLTLFHAFAKASGNSHCEIHYNEGDSSLLVQGLTVSEITYITSPMKPDIEVPEMLAICREWQPPDLWTASYKGGGSLLDAFLRTLIYDNTMENNPTNIGQLLSMVDCRKSFVTCMETSREGPDTDFFISLLRDYLPGRSFFMTREGYIGLCPQSAQTGDKVGILLGCDNPILLRPVSSTEGTYRVVGECYIDKLMWGEALLGPLPPTWKREIWLTPSGEWWSTYSDGNVITGPDPRLGPLPQGWREQYRARHDASADSDFEVAKFQNEETGEMTWFDPRLTSLVLKKRGVDIENIILI